MNENKISCAPADKGKTQWDSIDWVKAEVSVKKLQARIVKAQREGRYNKVKALQWTLTHSFYAKALAVKRVTSNGGGNTPGVDMETWDKPEAKLQAINALRRRGYQPKPLRRVHIKKSNGKLRPLGIPTMKDRAMQALYLMALEPVSETTADTRSYGFRKERRCMDAVMQCHNILRKGYSPEWILEGDIKGCFDHISHEWLLDNVIIDKEMLRKWLKAGVIEKNVFHMTDEGTPQGGIISPTLANITLDGMEALVAKHSTRRDNGKTYSNKVNLVRYADDFIVTGDTKEVLEEIKSELIVFLKDRGLELSEEKTLITHIKDGFDFLGFNIRKYGNGMLLIKPSKKNQKKFAESTHEVIYKMRSAKQTDVIGKLNPKISGWANYYRYVSSKEVFSKLDHIIFLQLRRWSIRRHHDKSLKWIEKKYWQHDGKRGWIFGTKGKDKKGKEKIYRLIQLTHTPILRYTKIRSKANPFDPRYDEYFKQRQETKSRTRPLKCSA